MIGKLYLKKNAGEINITLPAYKKMYTYIYGFTLRHTLITLRLGGQEKE